jgi:hypothetical protein
MMFLVNLIRCGETDYFRLSGLVTTHLDWIEPAGKVYRISEGSLGERVLEAVS